MTKLPSFIQDIAPTHTHTYTRHLSQSNGCDAARCRIKIWRAIRAINMQNHAYRIRANAAPSAPYITQPV